jgi:hypothetical protein
MFLHNPAALRLIWPRSIRQRLGENCNLRRVCVDAQQAQSHQAAESKHSFVSITAATGTCNRKIDLIG